MSVGLRLALCPSIVLQSYRRDLPRSPICRGCSWTRWHSG